jgi:hypothetical protein
MHTLSKNCTRKESKKAINISGQSTNVMVTALSKHYTILYCISASRNSQKCKFFAPIYFHSLYIYIMVVRSPLCQVDVPQPKPFFFDNLGKTWTISDGEKRQSKQQEQTRQATGLLMSKISCQEI